MSDLSRFCGDLTHGGYHNDCDGLVSDKEACACACHEPLTNEERFQLRQLLEVRRVG